MACPEICSTFRALWPGIPFAGLCHGRFHVKAANANVNQSGLANPVVPWGEGDGRRGPAELYGVSTRELNQAVKRNVTRFPPDFAFQLLSDDLAVLRSQIVISNAGRGGRRTRPWVFTEHGAIMAASVLNSRRAVDMSVFVVRAFIRLRSLTQAHGDIAGKLKMIERRVGRHDKELKAVFRALRSLLVPPQDARRPIGFQARPMASTPVTRGRGAATTARPSARTRES